MTDRGPLAGVTIVDLTMNMSGPYATLMLADQGADVIKVEPPRGDPIRVVGTAHNGVSSYFANLNRAKRSVVIDVTTTDGRALIDRLVDRSDVVIQNFRHGVAARLGLDAASLRKGRPTLVYVSINGWGTAGPLSDNPAYDHVVQALSGMATVQASPGGPPELIKHGVVDKATGQVAAQAITAALFQRSRTGEGCAIEISMLEVALSFLWPDGMMNNTCLDPVEVLPPITRSFRLTPTADGAVSLVTLTDAQWQGLIAAFPGAAAATTADLSSIEKRMRHGGDVMRRIRDQAASMTTAEVITLLEANGVPCAPVLALEDVFDHPQVVASGSVVEVEHPVLGRIRQPVAPAHFSTPEPAMGRSPGLGEHTAAVLAEIGYTPQEIARLETAGVIAS